MSHFAKTALMQKRAVEKRSEKHNAKTPKIHEKSMENSIPFLDAVRTPF